ncbi:MAG: PASTA domain-containing protein, partial [Blastocatellia bacterium]
VYPDGQMPSGMIEAGLHDYQMPDVSESTGDDPNSLAAADSDTTLAPQVPSQAATTEVARPPAQSLLSPAGSSTLEHPAGGSADELEVPDLRGRSIREAADICAGFGLKLRANGEGLVSQQTPAQGAVVKSGAVCVVTLTRQTPSGNIPATVAVKFRGAGASGGN